MDLLEKWEVDALRDRNIQAVSYNECNHDFDRLVQPATGRARCRCCGKKIPKGEKEITFCYDKEDNPWTAKTYHVQLSHIETDYVSA